MEELVLSILLGVVGIFLTALILKWVLGTGKMIQYLDAIHHELKEANKRAKEKE